MLNPKQTAFVGEYIKDLNATQAAIRAGYAAMNADVTGPKLLGNVGISKAVAEGMKAREVRTQINADYILTAARELLERCMQREPVLDKLGHETGVWRFDSAGANSALKLMASHVHGFIAPTKIDADVVETKRIVLVFPEAKK